MNNDLKISRKFVWLKKIKPSSCYPKNSLYEPKINNNLQTIILIMANELIYPCAILIYYLNYPYRTALLYYHIKYRC